MNNSSRRIEDLIEKIAVFTENNETGFTRFSYTDMDIEARKFIIEEMTKLNLDVYMDYLGNIFGRREGKNKTAPAILIGSHLDTVKDGGKYDGIAGVIAGIEVIRLPLGFVQGQLSGGSHRACQKSKKKNKSEDAPFKPNARALHCEQRKTRFCTFHFVPP